MGLENNVKKSPLMFFFEKCQLTISLLCFWGTTFPESLRSKNTLEVFTRKIMFFSFIK